MPRNVQKACCIIMVLPLIYFSCSEKKPDSLKPEGFEKGNGLAIESGALRAVLVDNTALLPDHKAGYNGIAQLSHSASDSSIFVPAYAGFNLEHIFGGDSLEQLFEPRRHPMTLYRKSPDEVVLHQEATPLSGVESLTEFKVVEPHYVDITFHCLFHNPDFFKHGYAGLFWASYIQDPGDTKLYFKGVREKEQGGGEAWIAASSDEHGVNSTHKSIDDDHDFFFAPNFNASLANHFSEYRYTSPYYFGRSGEMVLAYFFDGRDIIRFSQSPTGGGRLNPAWDFQYLIPSPEKGKAYTFRVRMVYKPFVSEDDISKEYQEWSNKN